MAERKKTPVPGFSEELIKRFPGVRSTPVVFLRMDWITTIASTGM
jgi:hypothetical protein